MGFFSKFFTKEDKKNLDKGLQKTQQSFFDKISKALIGKSSIDDDFLDELESILITADVGLDTTVKIINRIQERVSTEKFIGNEALMELLIEEINQLLDENKSKDVNEFKCGPEQPYIILVVGVNGVGKTTSIGKLAYQLKQSGKKGLIAAGDTFRAAAEDQLKIWSERVGCEFYSKGMGADPSAVAYEASKYALNKNLDYAIIDTAGRLHTKSNLMAELNKIVRSIGKSIPGAPHEILIVLDATTGQNAIEQCRQFSNSASLTGIILTKLDGSAKGGVALGISDLFHIPIQYIGTGESIDQFQVFNKRAFVESLFRNSSMEL